MMSIGFFSRASSSSSRRCCLFDRFLFVLRRLEEINPKCALCQPGTRFQIYACDSQLSDAVKSHHLLSFEQIKMKCKERKTITWLKVIAWAAAEGLTLETLPAERAGEFYEGGGKDSSQKHWTWRRSFPLAQQLVPVTILIAYWVFRRCWPSPLRGQAEAP